jgi:hypothetical protein
MSIQQQLAIEKTLQVSTYMKALFKRRLHNETANVEIPDHWTLGFIQECTYMVHVLAVAATNPGIYTPSSMRHYH